MQMCLNKAFLLLARQAETNPGFCSMKQLVVFVLPPGWDASPSQGYPKH